MSEPTTTQLARLGEIELTDVVAFGPRERVYCTLLRAWTVDGRVAPCEEHLIAQDMDCPPCHISGEKHEPCRYCKAR